MDHSTTMAGCYPREQAQQVLRPRRGWQQLGNCAHRAAVPRPCCSGTGGSVRHRFGALRKGDFSALPLSLPGAAKRDLGLVLLLFNLSELFWAQDPRLALPRDNLCQRS